MVLVKFLSEIKNQLDIYKKQLAIILEPKKQDRQKKVCTNNFIIYVEKNSAIFLLPWLFKNKIRNYCPKLVIKIKKQLYKNSKSGLAKFLLRFL